MTLSGRQPFVGFVLRARFITESYHTDQLPDGRLNKSVGEWVGRLARSVTVPCVGGQDGVTHSDVKPKTQVSFVWTCRSAHRPIQFVATVFSDNLGHRTEATSSVLQPNAHVAILKRSERDVKEEAANHQGNIRSVDATSEPPTTSYEDISAQTVTSGEQADDVSGDGPNYSHAIFYLCTIVASFVGMLTVFSLLLV